MVLTTKTILSVGGIVLVGSLGVITYSQLAPKTVEVSQVIPEQETLDTSIVQGEAVEYVAPEVAQEQTQSTNAAQVSKSSETKVVYVPQASSTFNQPTPTPKSEPKLFTTPNGSVIDEFGNLVKQATSVLLDPEATQAQVDEHETRLDNHEERLTNVENKVNNPAPEPVSTPTPEPTPSPKTPVPVVVKSGSAAPGVFEVVIKRSNNWTTTTLNSITFQQVGSLEDSDFEYIKNNGSLVGISNRLITLTNVPSRITLNPKLKPSGFGKSFELKVVSVDLSVLPTEEISSTDGLNKSWGKIVYPNEPIILGADEGNSRLVDYCTQKYPGSAPTYPWYYDKGCQIGY